MNMDLILNKIILKDINNIENGDGWMTEKINTPKMITLEFFEKVNFFFLIKMSVWIPWKQTLYISSLPGASEVRNSILCWTCVWRQHILSQIEPYRQWRVTSHNFASAILSSAISVETKKAISHFRSLLADKGQTGEGKTEIHDKEPGQTFLMGWNYLLYPWSKIRSDSWGLWGCDTCRVLKFFVV